MAAIKATATLTITTSVDIISTTIYYLLQSSTAPPPNKPTTDPPGGSWSTTEPTYTEGSTTNTLYTVTKTKYSGNIPGTNTDFEYTPVSKSTSYEAAKVAYSKSIEALGLANTADNKLIISSTEPSIPPEPYDRIWYDVTHNVYKKYFPANSGYGDSSAGWKEISSTVAELQNAKSMAQTAINGLGGIDDKVQSEINTWYGSFLKNYIDESVQTSFDISKAQAQISIIKTLFQVTKQPGETWYEGNKINQNGISPQSSVQNALVGDYYLNTDNGNVYICTTGGAPSTAVWEYVKSLLDTGEGMLSNVGTYFKFNSDDLSIGRTNFNHKLSLAPNQITMKYSQTPNVDDSWVDISYWNSTSFVSNIISALEKVETKYIKASEKQRIGDFVWVKNNDGSISLKQEVE